MSLPSPLAPLSLSTAYSPLFTIPTDRAEWIAQGTKLLINSGTCQPSDRRTWREATQAFFALYRQDHTHAEVLQGLLECATESLRFVSHMRDARSAEVLLLDIRCLKLTPGLSLDDDPAAQELLATLRAQLDSYAESDPKGLDYLFAPFASTPSTTATPAS